MVTHERFVLDGQGLGRIPGDGGNEAQFGMVLPFLIIKGSLSFLSTSSRVGEDCSGQSVEKIERPRRQLGRRAVVGEQRVDF